MSKDFRVPKDDWLDLEDNQDQPYSGKKHAGHDRRAINRAKTEQLVMRKKKVQQQTDDLTF